MDKMAEELEKRKNEYELKMKQIDCFVDSSSVTFPQVRHSVEKHFHCYKC